jgi:serine/threonine-protein kinase
VIVPPSTASPTDATTEITGPARTPVPDTADAGLAVASSGTVDSSSAVSAEPVPPIDALTVPARDALGTVDQPTVTAPGLDIGPVAPIDGEAPSAGAVDVHDELAALVERTPKKPAPTDDRPAVTAERGAKAPGGRKGRRAERKASKAAAKAARTSGRDAAVASPTTSSADLLASSPAPRRRRRWVPALLMVLVLAALGGIGYLAWVLFQTPKHEIPAVLGLPQDEALALVDDFKWDIELDEGRSDEYPDPGVVMSVTPGVGSDLSEGSPLLLVVSEGPAYRQVPDLAGVPLGEATAEIERLRLVAGEQTEDFSETVPEGSVISATVDGLGVGDNVLPGAPVNIVVSAGPQQRRVPQLRGLTAEQATQLLGDLGLQIIVEDPVFDDEIPSGEIAVQSPVPDTNVDRDSTITVSASKGPDLVTMPDLSDMTLAEIGQALEDSGLHLGPLMGVRSGVFYQAYLDGELLEAGDQVRRGSQISVLIFPV